MIIEKPLGSPVWSLSLSDSETLISFLSNFSDEDVPAFEAANFDRFDEATIYQIRKLYLSDHATWNSLYDYCVAAKQDHNAKKIIAMSFNRKVVLEAVREEIGKYLYALLGVARAFDGENTQYLLLELLDAATAFARFVGEDEVVWRTIVLRDFRLLVRYKNRAYWHEIRFRCCLVYDDVLLDVFHEAAAQNGIWINSKEVRKKKL